MSQVSIPHTLISKLKCNESKKAQVNKASCQPENPSYFQLSIILMTGIPWGPSFFFVLPKTRKSENKYICRSDLATWWNEEILILITKIPISQVMKSFSYVSEDPGLVCQCRPPPPHTLAGICRINERSSLVGSYRGKWSWMGHSYTVNGV